MLARLNRRLKEIERSAMILGTDISTPRGRRRARLYFLLFDHAFLRIWWKNTHEIAPGAWRSNQPSPARLAEFRRMGIRAVLNLRGANAFAPYLFEREACEKEGLKLIDSSFQARALSSPEVLLSLLRIFETIEHPFVMHCKSGADRAGLASALYLMHIHGVPVSEARKQLSLKYVHVKAFQTGILDHMLEAYEKDNDETPMPVREWIETRYDPVRLTAEFHARRARR